MQLPTLENTRIRSSADAQKIFYAVEKGILKMITKRLDVDERIALKSGNIYAWEERGPHTEVTGLGIERFTEGRRWSPSRVREDFLFYYEKYAPPPNHPGHSGSRAPRDWEGLVKQTYSVWKDYETEAKRRKWHLTAYFGSNSVDNLGTVDDLPVIAALEVPAGHYKSTRTIKPRKKQDKEDRKSSDDGPSVVRTYAPYPQNGSSPETPNSSQDVYGTYENNNRARTGPTNPYPVVGSSSLQVAPYPTSVTPSSAPSPAPPVYSNEMPSANGWTSSSPAASSPAFAEHPDRTYPYSSSQMPSPISPQPMYPTGESTSTASTPTPSWHMNYTYGYPGQQVQPQQFSRRNALPMVQTGNRGQIAGHAFPSDDTPSPRGEFPSPASPTPSSHSSTSSYNPLFEAHGQRDFQMPQRQHPDDRALAPLVRLHSVSRSHPYRRHPSDDLQLQMLERPRDDNRKEAVTSSATTRNAAP